MATIFNLFFRRILRPGLRVFGLQAFLKSDEHSISASEAHLRALEKELEARGGKVATRIYHFPPLALLTFDTVLSVDSTTLHAWISATIDITSPLRDVPKHVEGVTQQIFEVLQPVMSKFTSRRNTDKVKAWISAICKEAVRLKLAMRAADGSYKIEVPSRDSKEWGEPGCDQETMALKSKSWLQVVDHETEPDDTNNTRRTGGDIACIPFGALTNIKDGQDGGTKKVILEKGWVVSRGAGGKRKRKVSSVPAVEEERSKKRAGSNHAVPPAQLERIKALMGGE
jgi:hypothetical protein